MLSNFSFLLKTECCNDMEKVEKNHASIDIYLTGGQSSPPVLQMTQVSWCVSACSEVCVAPLLPQRLLLCSPL